MNLLKIMATVWHALANPWHGQRAQRMQNMLGYLLAVFITHAILRLCLLLRNDAYGMPLVGKADWYLFHAFSIDFIWIFTYSLPLLFMGAWFKVLSKPIWIILIAAHSFLLLFTLLDHETLRFLGMHLDPSLLGTYGNTAAMREVLHFVADDRSVRYLPYGLFFGCVPTSLAIAFYLHRNVSWMNAARLQVRPLGALVLAGLLAWLYVNVIWTGGFRMLKLRPFIETAWIGLARSESQALPDSLLAQYARGYQANWQDLQGDSSWIFPDSLYPYYRIPRETCQFDANITDIPGDGIDQDCNGVDAKPTNIVLLIFESHRAVNCGHLIPFGASASATPVLDSLAKSNRYWTRFSIGGIPTINALLAIHLGLVQHPTRFIASDFTTLSNQGFPAVLGRNGYQTHFFSAADPAWDNQTPWLRQWYQGVHYDRSRETDASMLQNMAQWMHDSLKKDKPFFVASMSKTNHYPFNPVPGVASLPDNASLQDRMLATMRYSDSALGDFFLSVKKESWFKNTLFIILGDHGFPLNEHGSSTIGYGLYTESTWIPLVVVGDNSRLPPKGPIISVASQIDLGPTLLDIAGIHTPNHFMGHSLLRPPSGQGEAVVLRGEQGLLESETQRWHGPIGQHPREQGLEVFDPRTDRMEKHNLWSALKPELTKHSHYLQELAALHVFLLEQNRIWPSNEKQP